MERSVGPILLPKIYLRGGRVFVPDYADLSGYTTNSCIAEAPYTLNPRVEGVPILSSPDLRRYFSSGYATVSTKTLRGRCELVDVSTP